MSFLLIIILTQPMPYLQRYKYYIQALENRLDKAKLNLQRDIAYQLDVDELKAKLVKKINAKDLASNSVDVIKISLITMSYGYLGIYKM
ncbi:hypothetical protein ACH24_00760 [Francisella persica ATCC VR-331]|uniref:RNA helicase HrpA C-terminal domain-containing protein n=1 Tax=Francisella persica ATCC VR-331 TaxID=1086726 RepID=A0AAC8VDA8_9GAMM|nr:DUF3418 domain-containing protein [Francisella persica]ALB01348.1 hypothetical protein ACH24_00760 [Francisella persica ATCC VR-331]